MQNGYLLRYTESKGIISPHRTEQEAVRASIEFYKALNERLKKYNRTRVTKLYAEIVKIVDGVEVAKVFYQEDSATDRGYRSIEESLVRF